FFDARGERRMITWRHERASESRVLERLIGPVELRLDVGDVAVGADPMTELRLEATLNVLLESFPFVIVVPDSLAVRADGQKHFELLQLLPQSEDAFCHREAGPQLVGVYRLGDEVIRTG